MEHWFVITFDVTGKFEAYVKGDDVEKAKEEARLMFRKSVLSGHSTDCLAEMEDVEGKIVEVGEADLDF